MSERIAIDFAPAEGAVIRILGLVERRGFIVRAIAMADGDGVGRMTLDVEARDAGRRLDVLDLQLRRLHDVREVSISGRAEPVKVESMHVVEEVHLAQATVGQAGSAKPLWALHKMDIRAPVTSNSWPVARVELEHCERGRVTDLASAPGALDATFAAISHIIGVPARVDRLDLHYVAADRRDAKGDGQGADVLVDIALEVDSEIFAGRARARDVLPSCVAAYIDAASNADAARRVRAAVTEETKAA